MGESLKVAAALPNTAVAELMNQLSLGLMHGELIIRSGRRRRTFHPGHVIKLEIHADEDADKGSMCIELHWRVPLRVTTSTPESGLLSDKHTGGDVWVSQKN